MIDLIAQVLGPVVPAFLVLVGSLVGMAALVSRSRWKEDERKKRLAEAAAKQFENTEKLRRNAGELARANEILAEKRRASDREVELRKAALLAKPTIEPKDVEAIEARTRADEDYLAESERKAKD